MLSLFPVVSIAITDQVVAKFLKLESICIILVLFCWLSLSYHLISSTINFVPSDMQGKPAFKIHYRILFTLRFQSFHYIIKIVLHY